MSSNHPDKTWADHFAELARQKAEDEQIFYAEYDEDDNE